MQNQVYLINSDQEQFNIFFHPETSRMMRVSKELSVDQMTNEQIDELLKQFKKENSSDVAVEKVPGRGTVALTFMSARTCNLGCTYCFAGEGEYGSVSDKPAFFTKENYMNAVRFALENYSDGIKSMCFFGGEPMINFREIKSFVREAQDFLKKNDMEFPPTSICTNLVGISSKAIEFLKDNNIFIVTSLDGPKKLNDLARIYQGDGKLSVYDNVVKGINRMKEQGVSYVLQATINRNHLENYQQGDGVKWAKAMDELGWENLAIVPVDTGVESLAITGERLLSNLESFTREITQYYIGKLYKGETDQIPSGIIAPLIQIAKDRSLRDCNAGHSLFFDTNMHIYPCQMFVNEEKFNMGNIEEGLNYEKAHGIANVSRQDAPECQACFARKICSVFCKGIQFQSHGDMYVVSSPRCTFSRTTIEESIKTLATMDKTSAEYKLFWDSFKKVSKRTGNFGYTKT